MDFAPFDKRGYRNVSVRTGYTEWASQYEATVASGLDRRLLERLLSPQWPKLSPAADLACGTGRTAIWLADRGVRHIDGLDITWEMLQIARTKNIYRHLHIAEVSATGLRSSHYNLCTMVLADEHLIELTPVY
ncbi:MAG TPA: class I SAM-dependent methyltransferase, partial [Candidatus Binataceae bacterium]|nr:class I SAM-dependent methyltransferase [Candidatus Binataceae bacterium]